MNLYITRAVEVGGHEPLRILERASSYYLKRFDFIIRYDWYDIIYSILG